MSDVLAGSAKRVDELGRAYAGSQLQLQLYVHCRRAELDQAIFEAIPVDKHPLEWLSPVSTGSFKEYRDGEFLRVTGLGHLLEPLKLFWPASGPRWDGLAGATAGGAPALVLVEAKNYPREVRGSGCQAREGSSSRRKITNALKNTGLELGIDQTAQWTGSLYQYANRLAHATFLRSHGVNAFMVNVCFYEDPHERRYTSLPVWRNAAADLKTEVGFKESPAWLGDAFLKARDRSEFVPPAT